MLQQEREPVDWSDESGPEAAAEPRVRLARQKPGVLVVDDEHMVRVMVQLGLERGGFEVWLAQNGSEAIDLYRRHREQIGVVLLDVRMPGLDGPHTLNALRALDPTVQACFMSGEMGAYEPNELLKCGAAIVIDKPFRLGELVTILRNLTDGVPASLRSSGPDLA